MFLGAFCGRNRQTPIKIAEIGVLNGASIHMWRDYFGTDTEIHAFDISRGSLDTVAHIPNVHTHLLDSGNPDAINTIFGQLGEFDIIIEDASHRLEHQVTCIRECTKYLKSGGVLVVEDIFRAIPTARFQESINALTDINLETFMITPEDDLRFSPGWNNDRLLIVRRL
jgi:cephalosporin hydroxylase